MNQAIGPNQELWLSALESKKYAQGKDYLCVDGKHCCLGVGCRVAGIPETPYSDRPEFGAFCGERFYAPARLVEFLALVDNEGGVVKPYHDFGFQPLVRMNDGGMMFEEIAGVVRRNPKAYFTEPR